MSFVHDTMSLANTLIPINIPVISVYKDVFNPLGKFHVLLLYNTESKYIYCGFFDTDKQKNVI